MVRAIKTKMYATKFRLEIVSMLNTILCENYFHQLILPFYNIVL